MESCESASLRRRRNANRGRRTEHRLAVAHLAHFEADTKTGLTVDLRGQRIREVLRDQQQVHAEPCPDARNGLEPADLRMPLDRFEQFDELVDDHQQTRDDDEFRPPFTGRAVPLQRAHSGLVPKDRLPTFVFRCEQRDRSLEEVDVLVGRQRDDMWQLRGQLVIYATLEVDDRYCEVVGVVEHRQRRDPGLQKLGLARPGHAADQPVWAMFDEVDREEFTVHSNPDRHVGAR